MKNMFGMNVYISEGRRAEVLKVLKEVVGIGVAASAASSTSHKHSHDRPSAVIDENNNKSDTNRMGNGVSSSENNGGRRVTLVSHFVDTYYNRSSFTLAACMNQQGIDALVEMAVRLAKQAIEEIDMEEHCARHPRLGVVDHISCHELRRRTITTAAETAEKAETILRRGRCSESDGSYDDDDYGVSSATLANAVGRALGEQLNIPVMMYGSATNKNINGSDKSVSLAEIRRSVGYFSRKQKPYNGNNSGSSNSETRQVMDDDEWTGLPTQLLQLQPSHSSSPSSQNTLNNTKVIHNQSTSPIEYIKYGPRTGFVDSSIGISCIGSVPWVTNFNVQLYTGDMILAKVLTGLKFIG